MFGQKTCSAVEVLSRREIGRVLASIHQRPNNHWCLSRRTNLAIFRLACCCGLRVGEISGLKLGDVRTQGEMPHLALPKEITKGKRPRIVPLWWDEGTLVDLKAWVELRRSQGASDDDPLVCLQHTDKPRTRLTIRAVQRRWRRMMGVLGSERQRILSIHKGRHTYCTHALVGGRTPAEVRDAAGHANLSTTCRYLHVLLNENEPVGRTFDFGVAA